jgi:hypothetical protein
MDNSMDNKIRVWNVTYGKTPCRLATYNMCSHHVVADDPKSAVDKAALIHGPTCYTGVYGDGKQEAAEAFVTKVEILVEATKVEAV